MLQLRRDKNGNKTLYYSNGHYRGFSVQTNGNLPKTHKMSKENFSNSIATSELNYYVKEYGTQRQKEMLGWY